MNYKISISILGSTGSIASSVFEIIDKRKFYFKINLLSSNKNYNLICKQIRKYKPKFFLLKIEKFLMILTKNLISPQLKL